jgi:hypothetical protein
MESTLLFFDDHHLSVRDNVIRGVGRPTLIPESVWHDEPRLNTAWGYPSIHFDADKGVWRLWYQASVVKGKVGHGQFVKLMAESRDGLHWRQKDTTRQLSIRGRRFKHQVADGVTEWSGLLVDERAAPDERFRRLAVKEVWASGDGVRWRHVADWRRNVVDMSAFPYHNPVLKRDVIIGRQCRGDRRMCTFQTDDWRKFSDPVLSLYADAMDEPLTDTYGMPVFHYEGWFVALLWLYHGPNQHSETSPYKYTAGKVDCQLAYSLNGLHFQRTLRQAFIPNGGPGSPDAGCVYPSALVPKPELKELWIYASACTWEHALTPRGTGSILAYRLRKDGFVYLESRSGPGRLATKPLYWRGGELSLNLHGQGGPAVVSNGYLCNGARVQINGYRGNPIPGYTFADCRPYAGDNLAWKPTWKNGRTLDALKGKDIIVAIELHNARLYALRGNFIAMAPREWCDLTEKGQPPQVLPGF